MSTYQWLGNWSLDYALPEIGTGTFTLKTVPASFDGSSDFRAYECVVDTNNPGNTLPAFWKGCIFLKVGKKKLTAPTRLGVTVPYAPYDANRRADYDWIYSTALANREESTERLIAAVTLTGSGLPDPRTAFLILYRIPKALQPDNNDPNKLRRDYLLAELWDPVGGGGGHPGGGGTGGRTYP